MLKESKSLEIRRIAEQHNVETHMPERAILYLRNDFACLDKNMTELLNMLRRR